MKIAILVSDFYPHAIGGTEIQAYNIAKRLSKKHKVIVITRKVKGKENSGGNGFIVKRFRYLDFPLIGFFSHLLFSLLEIWKIRKNIDFIQCMMIRPNGVVGAVAKKIFGIKYCVWLRSEYKHFGRGKGLSHLLSKIALKNSDVIITQTGSIKKEVLRDYPNKKVKVVANGVSIHKKRPRGKSILFVGNLIERKGVEHLIRAVRILQSEGIKSETVIVGDGNLRGRLEKLSEGLNIHFAGRVYPDELKSYFEKASIFVLPSVSGKGEGLPNVILEAMSYGIAIIASKIAGIPDVINHGKTGFLVEPGDSESIARYIKILLKDKEKHREMSENCIKEVKKYSWDNVIKNLENVYWKTGLIE